jgi:hypothetical protein
MEWLIAVAALVLSASAAFPQQDAAPYCADLQRVVRLSASSDQFASITGKPREGSFHETTLPLVGWKDCTIYAQRTYACNSEAIDTADEAHAGLATIVRQIKSCFGDGWWVEDALRSSPVYVVLQHPVGLATMTVSADEEAKNMHVVRLIMFLRR